MSGGIEELPTFTDALNFSRNEIFSFSSKSHTTKELQKDAECEGFASGAPPIFCKQSYLQSFRNSRGGTFLQRLFSAFPGGLPGLGLLLLRTTLGITSFVQGAIYLSEQSGSSGWTSVAAIAAVAGGVLMLLGFLTPVIGALLFIGGLITVIFTSPYSVQICASPLIYGIVLSAAVALLGPGAFSVDTRLFGRREIIIPKN